MQSMQLIHARMPVLSHGIGCVYMLDVRRWLLHETK